MNSFWASLSLKTYMVWILWNNMPDLNTRNYDHQPWILLTVITRLESSDNFWIEFLETVMWMSVIQGTRCHLEPVLSWVCFLPPRRKKKRGQIVSRELTDLLRKGETEYSSPEVIPREDHQPAFLPSGLLLFWWWQLDRHWGKLYWYRPFL